MRQVRVQALEFDRPSGQEPVRKGEGHGRGIGGETEIQVGKGPLDGRSEGDIEGSFRLLDPDPETETPEPGEAQTEIAPGGLALETDAALRFPQREPEEETRRSLAAPLEGETHPFRKGQAGRFDLEGDPSLLHSETKARPKVLEERTDRSQWPAGEPRIPGESHPAAEEADEGGQYPEGGSILAQVQDRVPGNRPSPGPAKPAEPLLPAILDKFEPAESDKGVQENGSVLVHRPREADPPGGTRQRDEAEDPLEAALAGGQGAACGRRSGHRDLFRSGLDSTCPPARMGATSTSCNAGARMTPPPPAVLHTDLPCAKKLGEGKVRDIYALGGDLLLVASDRVSAFDVVLGNGIPGRGVVLTSLSSFWFRMTRDIVDNHCLGTEVENWPELDPESRELLRGRAMRCQKADPLPVEWVVRGYLTGSGWKDYLREGRVSGVELPDGLGHAARLDPPILTPSTKAESGHDEPISFEEVVSLLGEEHARRGRDLALALYERGRDFALEKGFVIADTKFEFGLFDGKMILIDECLTPDSSRFWPADQVREGAFPESYDKQVVRDWLERSGWDKRPPAPSLPDEVVREALGRYLHIHEALTGRSPF